MKQDSLPSELKTRLEKAGFMILDLGTDFEMPDHVYYLLSKQRGRTESDRLLNASELDEFVRRL